MSKQQEFNGKVVIVTGASSGIGKAVAIAFARAGAYVVLASRSKDKLEEVAQAIQKFSNQVLVLPTDVSVKEQIEAMVKRTLAEFGRIDVLVNNAGGAATGSIEADHFVDDVLHLFNVDYLGKAYAARAVIPQMRKQGTGSIINLSSVVGRKAFPGFAAYSSAMHAVAAFSDALRQELKSSGIHVATIHPALTQTAFFDAFNAEEVPATFRYMTPVTAELVAERILTAVRNKQSRVIVPWQPRLLIMSEAVSAYLGDWVAARLQNKFFMALIGMYKGRTYQFSR